MARPLRLEFAHALYHVTSRGDRREDIYHDDSDRQAWLTVLAQVCKRFNWTVHAYCLMSNHYHLLVETPDANLSAGMRQLNGVYTQLSNRAHGRVGHVFQGRFKAIVVDKDGYLLELARYVVLNPVRAGMVQDPAQWPWSSHGAMLAPGWLPSADWLATDKLLAYFAPEQPTLDREKAQQRYVNHVREGIGLPSVWEKLSGQVYLGNEKFVNKMSAMAEQSPQGARTVRSRLEIPHAQRRPVPLPLQAYAEQHPNNRNAAIQVAFATGSHTMAQLAEHFKLHYTSVSRIVKNL
jgi:putative transposase